MRATIFLPLFVIIVATIVSTNADENENLMDYAKRLTKSIGFLTPINLLKRLPIRELDDLDHATSTKCEEQIKLLAQGLQNTSVWAIKMMDASSKIPSGVLIGNVADLGAYDECVEIAVRVGDNDIRGQHCMYFLSVGIGEMKMTVESSVCMPASCSPEDVRQILQSGMQGIEMLQSNITATVGETTCSPVDPAPWTFGGIATVVGLILLLSFLIVCTIVDVFARYTNEKSQPNTFIHTIRELSLSSGVERILITKKSPQTLPALQGLRFWSMCWVIVGHSHIQFLMNSSNFVHLFQWLNKWESVHLMTAPFSVDTFFALGGFLMTYGFLKDRSAGLGFNLFSHYLHRYLRLTPALAALVLFTMFIMPRLGSGATWENAAIFDQESCRHGWWTVLFYLQNYVRIKPRGCVGHTWYLAVEMQLFWLSPLILYPLAKKPKIGLCILGASFVGAIVGPIIIGWNNKYSTMMLANFSEDSMTFFYTPTHIRAVPWLAGILCGYLIFTRKETSTRTVIKWVGWLVATASFSFCILTAKWYQSPDYRYLDVWEAIYTALARPCWSFGVMWIAYASIQGFGGPVKTFLSYSIYDPMCRISYCVFLIHYQIQLIKLRSVRVPPYFSTLNAIDHACSDLLMAVIGGFVFTLLFESPVGVLEKKFRRKNVKTGKNGKRVTKMHELENGVSNPGLTMS